MLFSVILILNSLFCAPSLIEDLSDRLARSELQTVKDLDLNSEDYTLSLMGDVEGRSIIFKIKDRDGRNIAVFKPTSGSTVYRAEYAMFRLGSSVGLNIYPATVIAELPVKRLEQALALLKDKKFNAKAYDKKHAMHFKRKEENRLIMIDILQKLIDEKRPLQGALKAWVPYLQFYKPLGTMAGLRTHPVLKYLKAENPRPGHTEYMLKQCTEIMEPKGCYTGRAFIDELARDLSGMMVMDAVMGINDRFPGGNVHFRALTDDIKKNGRDEFFYPIARLFSLDNGSALKDDSGLKILKSFGICRFVKSQTEALLTVKAEDLGLDSEESKIFTKNRDALQEHIDYCRKRHGEGKIWF